MAATKETVTDTTAGFRKVWHDAVTTVQARFKDVEKIWGDAFGQINSRLGEVEKDVREFVKKVEDDGKKRIDGLRTQLKVDDLMAKTHLDELVARLKPADLMEQGAKLTSETIEKLGLATHEELAKIEKKLDKVAKKAEEVRKTTNSRATAKSVTDLTKRVDALEKALKAAQAKTA